MPLLGRTNSVPGNIVSLLASDGASKVTTFAVYALVARHLGAHQFGQMSLALSLFYAFQVVAVAGIRTLVIREVARDSSASGYYLANGSIVITASSVLCVVLMGLFARLMSYSQETTMVIFITSMGLLPYALSSLAEAIFQAWEKMSYIVFAQVPVNLAKMASAIAILYLGYDVKYVVGLLSASLMVLAFVEWGLVLRYAGEPRVRPRLENSIEIGKRAITFLGIDSIAAIWASLNIVLLSKFTTEAEVGFYSATTQMTVPVLLILQSVVMAVFPAMSRTFGAGGQDLRRISERLIGLLMSIALPAAIGLFFFSERVLLLFYGRGAFLEATGALQIMCWTLIIMALTHALGRMLIAGGREGITLSIVVIDVTVGLMLGVILVGRFGLMGAAIAALLTRMVDLVQHLASVSKHICRVDLFRLTWRPAGAGMVMAIYLALRGSEGFILPVISAGMLYAAMLFILAVLSSGGPRQLKSRFLRILSGDST